MKYSELSRGGKCSFQNTLKNQMYWVETKLTLKQKEYPFVTKTVVEDILKSLSRNKGDQTWEREGLELDFDMLEALLHEKEKKMRQKKIPEGRINYYRDLSKALGRESNVPTDFVTFFARLESMEEEYVAKGMLK